MGMTRRKWGLGLLATLGLLSFFSSQVFPKATASWCPLGHDVLRPERTVCELALGGLWVSLLLGLLAGALSTALGLVIAFLAGAFGKGGEWLLMRGAEASF